MGYKNDRKYYFFRATIVLLWFLWRGPLWFSATPTYFFMCFVIYFAGYPLYSLYRNEHISSKCDDYLKEGDYEGCWEYIEDRVVYYPKTIKIKLIKLRIALMLCDMNAYDRCLDELKRDEKFNHKKVQRNITYLNYIKRYLTCENGQLIPSDIRSIRGGAIEKAARVIYKKEMNLDIDKVMNEAARLSGSEINFYKSLGLLIRAELYNAKNDVDDRNLYFEKAKSFSTTEYMTKYIQMHEELMKNS